MSPAAASFASISIAGPTLASLLHSAAFSLGECDGLLFGRASQPRLPSASFRDDGGESGESGEAPSGPAGEGLAASDAVVTGVLIFPSSRSFYDGAGRVQPERLARHLGRADHQQLLGWISVRAIASASASVAAGSRSSPPTLRPSMREGAITTSLASGGHTPPGLPALLCLVACRPGGTSSSSSPALASASASTSSSLATEYVFCQRGSLGGSAGGGGGGGGLGEAGGYAWGKPLPLRILNLGEGLAGVGGGAGGGDGAAPMGHGPGVAFTPASRSGAGLGGGGREAMLRGLADAAAAQAAQVRPG